MSNVWHPYAGLPAKSPPLTISKTHHHHLQLASGEQLLDGIASWWTAIFGYNHPALIEAIQQQSQQLSHVMFAGLTHPTAEALAEKLARLLPYTPSVFFSDSGSVAVEVALKMARQYWQALGKPDKKRFMALRHGYHGDTWGAMSVTDPNGMHQQFSDATQHNFFVPAPRYDFNQQQTDHSDLTALEHCLASNHQEIAAIILEPIWQGAGAMNFYSPAYLQSARRLCDQYQVLLIADEIATGFGKTGALFAHQHAQIQPDIICLGKALSGGMLTLAATCTSQAISDTISQHAPHRFMHGPTYMANALACAVANASLALLSSIDWQHKVLQWQTELQQSLGKLTTLETVKDVRVLGHVGVVEMHSNIQALAVQPIALQQGIWLRPFGNWVYLTPAYTMSNDERATLLSATTTAIEQASRQPNTNLDSVII